MWLAWAVTSTVIISVPKCLARCFCFSWLTFVNIWNQYNLNVSPAHHVSIWSEGSDDENSYGFDGHCSDAWARKRPRNAARPSVQSRPIIRQHTRAQADLAGQHGTSTQQERRLLWGMLFSWNRCIGKASCQLVLASNHCARMKLDACSVMMPVGHF